MQFEARRGMGGIFRPSQQREVEKTFSEGHFKDAIIILQVVDKPGEVWNLGGGTRRAAKCWRRGGMGLKNRPRGW